jgi:hypothetical protein
MKKIYLPILIGLAALLCSSAVLAQLSATVDRNQIALDETLNMTISKDGSSAISPADLQPLAKDFKILGRSQSSNTQIVNGSMSSSSTLNLVLAPKRAGVLEIPSLLIDKEKTAPLTVKVVTQAQPQTRADNAPLYLETEVSERTVFVQAQVIFTLRIFWAVEASINEPADPQLKEALLERLNDATYNKVIDGRSYKVFERKYAIFPQQSGVLEIPQIVVQASVPDRQGHRGNLYDFFGNRGQEVKLRSESATVTVREKPPAYPAGAEWLPTDKLSIVEEWSREPGELRVGESATITITMAAQGLLGAQLPPVALLDTEGVKLYQGKAEVQNLTTAEGITGIRKESIALIPIRAGSVVLPEIRMPWWNIKKQQVEYAVVPARQLVVKADPAATGAAGSFTPPAPAPSSSIGPARQRPEINKTLAALGGFLTLAWLLTLFLLLRTRHQLANLRAGAQPERQAAVDLKEKEAFGKFGRACRSNDPVRARTAVIAWAKAFRPEERVRSGADLERLFPDSKLGALLAEIDNLLYSPGKAAADWHGKNLFDTVEQLRKTGTKITKNATGLPELYR